MNKYLFLLIFVFQTLFIQSQIGCKFDQCKDSLMGNHFYQFGQLKQNFDSFSRSAPGESLAANYDTVTIPVVFHVVHGGEFIGQGSNISDELIEEQLLILNNDLAQLDLTLKPGFGPPTDTKFRFCFAKTDPFGQPTNGITRIFGKDYYEFNVDTGVTIDDVFIKSRRWNPNIYLNIYITDLRPEGDISNVEGVPGYSSLPEVGSFRNGFPSDFENALDGIVMNYRFIGSDPNYVGPQRNQILTHEIGHWLGLFHVFESVSCSLVQDNDRDCEIYSDEICDTPFLGSPSDSYIDVESCTGQYVSPQNMMDYGPEISFFTEQQVARMHQKTAFHRPDIYNMRLLNSDCTINHNISQGGSGGSTTGYCSEDPVRIINNSFLDFNNSYSFPFDENDFGSSVDINQDWLVGTDATNKWLQIFKRVGSDFISFQNFNQPTEDFGKEVILNGNEIFISGKRKVFIYKYDGENWNFTQVISVPNDFGGIYIKNDFVFVLGSSTINIYKKNNTGDDYLNHQTLNHNFIYTSSNTITEFPGSNEINSRLIALGRDKKITIIGLLPNNLWSFESTQTYPELPHSDYFSGVSVATTESNIFIMYRKTGRYGAPPHKNTLYVHPINNFDVDGNSSNNTPFTSHDIQGISGGEYSSYTFSKRTNQIKALNDNLILHSFGVFNTGADFIENTNNSWRQKAMLESSSCGAYGFREAQDFKIFNNELVLGGDGVVEFRNLNCYIENLTFNNYNQICSIPSTDYIFSEEIKIGGLCDVSFENVVKEFVAKNSIVISPGTSILGGSDVSFRINETTGSEYYCSNITYPDDLWSLKVNVVSLSEETETNKNSGSNISDTILVAPNPTNGLVEVVSTIDNPIVSVSITGLNGGQLLYHLNEQRLLSFPLDLSAFPSGMYIINLKMFDGQYITRKIIKM